MANVITYGEYCKALNIPYNEDPEVGPVTQTPDWFSGFQRRALRLIKECLAQSHLVPTTRLKLGMLKCRFIQPVIEGIAHQIKFMKENEITFDNGWLNTDTSFGVGQYSQGPMNKYNIERTFRTLHPDSFACFDEIGWTYASLEHKLKISDYYNISKEVCNYGENETDGR